jgi:hypothetical protein
MPSTKQFSCPGLGAVLAFNDHGDLAGAGLFGPGFDGHFVVLTVLPEKDAEGLYPVCKPFGQGDGMEWPDPGPYAEPPVGTCALVVSADGNSLDLAFTIKRAALNYPAVDFSPRPPEDVTGSVTMARIA